MTVSQGMTERMSLPNWVVRQPFRNTASSLLLPPATARVSKLTNMAGGECVSIRPLSNSNANAPMNVCPENMMMRGLCRSSASRASAIVAAGWTSRNILGIVRSRKRNSCPSLRGRRPIEAAICAGSVGFAKRASNSTCSPEKISSFSSALPHSRYCCTNECRSKRFTRCAPTRHNPTPPTAASNAFTISCVMRSFHINSFFLKDGQCHSACNSTAQAAANERKRRVEDSAQWLKSSARLSTTAATASSSHTNCHTTSSAGSCE
mmetsp:Transcript_36456/g.90929  ORF Transcript_36456/g.90929 Transcript_36456/m.90929 type:complete len:264 (+) Transcript_36456:697-1488(+)